ncbi:MAG: UDP-N-acetylmuramoyl-tripeptide--D-alanyl-D-alanine ligase [Parachlamydiaceae bacterium]
MKRTPFKQVARILGSESLSEAVIQGVAVDSRLLRQGDLFLALPGEKTDGHQFLSQAAERGASGAVVSMDYQGDNFGLPLIRSRNVLGSLQYLAKTTLQESDAYIVAVTGSLGKTTTKGFISSLLKQKFKVTSSPGNSNSQIGLPLTILNHVTFDEHVIVLEMGMTGPGHITQLVEIAPPDIAVVTIVSMVHACYFDSIEDIARAKGEIFSHPLTSLGIYHQDSDLDRALSSSGTCNKKSFSTTSCNADFYLLADDQGLLVTERAGTSFRFSDLEVPGKHNHHNFLSAVAVAKSLGMSHEEIAFAQKTLELPERRLQFIEKSGVLFINDAYNASALSIEAALNALPEPPIGGRKIAVLGGIVELGKFSEEIHRAVGEYALNHVDCMFCFGEDCLPIFDCWQSLKRPVVWAVDRQALLAALRKQLLPGDVVLLKGSHVKEVYKILDEL